MVDIHAHILPGVDDGAPDLATTGAMLRMAQADGTTMIVATPHCDYRYSCNAEQCRYEIARIKQEYGTEPAIVAGCELHLSPENLDAVLKDPARFTINGADCILLELPNPVPFEAVENAVQLLLSSSLRPVIAHPERNALFQRNAAYATRLRECGAYMQVTAQSIMGSFGRDVQRVASALLKQRDVHVIASDAHGIEHRRPMLSAAYAEISRLYGEIAAKLLFVENPTACITGRPIHAFAARTLFSSFFRRSSVSPHTASKMS